MRPGNKRFGRWLVVLGVLLGGSLLAGCGSTPPDGGSPGGLALPDGRYKVGNPYQIAGRWYYPSYDPSYAAVGVASWYGHPFHGRRTANGEVFDRNLVSAAHPTLPLPSIVRVTNLDNQRQLELRVNDRGPFVGERIIDLSQAAARALGFERRGTTQVRVEFVRLANAGGVPPEPTVPRVMPVAVPQDTPVAATQPAAAQQPPASMAVPAVPATQTVLVSAAQAAPPLGDTADKRCLSAGFIQVGAFVESERALRLAKDLEAALAMPVSADLPTVDRYARVRLGPIEDSQQADAALRWLHRTGYAGAFLVKPDVATSVAC